MSPVLHRISRGMMTALRALLVLLGAALLHCEELKLFKNPILNRPDLETDKYRDSSWIPTSLLRVGDKYYMSLTKFEEISYIDYSKIFLFETSQLTKFNWNVMSIPLQADPKKRILSTHLFAYNGSLYIYFSMQQNMCVIKADSIKDPMGRWSEPIQLFNETNIGYEATHEGIMMEHDTNLYLITTIWYKHKLMIYSMESPTQIANPEPTLLEREPEDWECVVENNNRKQCWNENPSVVYKNSITYLVFTAGGSYDFETDRKLGYLSISSGQNPLNASHWKWHSGPVFTRNFREEVGNICCSSFTTSPDGTETWMMYHAAPYPYLHGNMTPRLEKISWNGETGEPEFPVAHGLNQSQPVPSGQKDGDLVTSTAKPSSVNTERPTCAPISSYQPDNTTPASNSGPTIYVIFHLWLTLFHICYIY